MQKRVFISYRREDTGPDAGRVYDRLSRLLSKSNVFFDVSTIRGGENFEKKIASEISMSDAVLIFIGDKWLELVQSTGKPRLWEPGDYVRAELRAALDRPILVLPVLVDGARMPTPEQLPEDLRAITAKNALRICHESFDDDTENIVATLLGGSTRKRTWEDKGTLWPTIAYAIGGAFAASAVMLIGALIHFWVLARPVSASIGVSATILILIAGSTFGVWIGLHYAARKRN